MGDPLRDIIDTHRAGRGGGIYSVCSAHPIVLEAAITQAVEDGTVLLVEATSNQVDQFGGYTGMTPVAFRDFVLGLATSLGLAEDRLVLGGDHLGPNRWQTSPAEEAMELAEGLVAAYVEAGYTKIHLDCSMACADDRAPLDDETVAGRAARLMAVAESAAARCGVGPLSYVVGTEVPVPGGAHETLHRLTPTHPDAARATIAAHRRALADRGLEQCWDDVVALVVQPAVEFDHVQVIDYDPVAAAELSTVVTEDHGLVFEAHSTDYQTPENLARLVRDHWAVLKVGPGLTFALREGLFALARIEDELVPAGERSRLVEIVDAQMRANPGYWEGYYDGDAHEQRLARQYSYSDRLRYYWPDPVIEAAVQKLFDNLGRTGIPGPLVSQHLPEQYARIRAGELDQNARALAVDKVRDALRPYAAACRPTTAITTAATGGHRA